MNRKPEYIQYQGELKRYQGQYLPHWEVDDGIFFVTFRLADSLSKPVARRLTTEYERRLETYRREHDPTGEELSRFGFRYYLDEVDPKLDDGAGECWLERPEMGEVMADALRYFDGDRYLLFAWVVMPNHVHVAFRKKEDVRLRKIYHSWKSYTSNQAVDLFGRTVLVEDEKFWQRDNYDRLIRTDVEFENVCNYICRNPVDAGLEEWPWVEQVRRG